VEGTVQGRGLKVVDTAAVIGFSLGFSRRKSFACCKRVGRSSH
jgi:hypothetical protein